MFKKLVRATIFCLQNVVALASFYSCAGRADLELSEPASPAQLFDGTIGVDIFVSGKPAAEDLRRGVEIRFQAAAAEDGQGGMAVARLSRQAASAAVEIRLSFRPRAANPPVIWGRAGARRPPDLFFLIAGAGRAELANAYLDPAAGRLTRFTVLNDAARSEAAAGAFIVAFQPAAAGAFEVCEWIEKEDHFKGPAPVSGPGPAAPFFGGWVFPSPGDLAKEDLFAAWAAELKKLYPPEARPVIEFGEGWKDHPLPAGAAQLASEGYPIGLHFVPFGTSDADIIQGRPQALLRDERGKPVRGGELGKWVFDPAAADGRSCIVESASRFLKRRGGLVARLRIGKAAPALSLYQRHLPGLPAREALRLALEAVREAAGPEVHLAGDGEAPGEACACLQSSSPRLFSWYGGDRLRQEALAALEQFSLYLNGWRGEALILPAGGPFKGIDLEDESALQALIVFRTLTGKPWYFSGLPGKTLLEKWPGLERGLPAAAVRAFDLDLEAPSNPDPPPRIWILKAGGEAAPSHDILGFFNWDPFAAVHLVVPLADLGLNAGISGPAAKRFLVMDRWDRRILGTAAEQLDFYLPPRSARLVSIHEIGLEPRALSGALHLLGEGETKLAAAGVNREPASLDRHVKNLEPRAQFEKSTGGVLLEWSGLPSEAARWISGYEVYRNGVIIARTFDTRFLDLPKEDLAGQRLRYAVGVRSIDGALAGPALKAEFQPPPPADAFLDELAPLRQEQAWGFPGKNQAANGGPLRIGGKACRRGVGVAVPSRLSYALRGRFQRLEARAGIDGAAALGLRAVFRVELDGQETFRSPIVRYGDPAVEMALVLGEARVLTLIAAPADGERTAAGEPLATWAEAILKK
ncbi:MAG: NPCBM/NEW2 domain-containing protein [Planctomycetes bacterium]|nr:NPCBM/NEW2 domain-containing protein [Planctomycetota bacterium]